MLPCRLLFPLAALLLTGLPVADADLIRLKSGGEVRGTIDRNAQGSDVVIRTLFGAELTIAKDDVAFLTYRSASIEEYETRAKSCPRTVDDQWALAEWCRLKGLKEQRNTHLTIITELEPDHAQARLVLGHILHEGEWVEKAQLMRDRGYVEHKGRWITPQELALIEKSNAELEAEMEWHKNVRLWLGWAQGRNAKRQQEGLTRLREIDTPDAIAALVRMMQKDENPQVRALFLTILSKIPGPKAVKPLVWQALYDNNSELRYQALVGLDEEQQTQSLSRFAAELKSDHNVVVNRAARALQIVGNESVLPHLIEALVTTHQYRVFVEVGGNSFSMTNGGGFAGGGSVLPPDVEAMLRSGQLPNGVQINHTQKPPTRKRPLYFKHRHLNEPVLAALQKLTGENFGYDERSWRLWLTSQKDN